MRRIQSSQHLDPDNTVDHPRLSVIVVSCNAEDTIGRCLSALQNQETDEDYEVILVDSSDDDATANVARRFPEVLLYRFSDRKFPGHARNLGIARARGEILAFTDADCISDRSWVGEILRAHDDPYPVIGGTIDNGNPESYVGWAYYFCELSQWMPGTPAGPMIDIPTGCLSMKRWAFEKYGPFLEGTYSSDTAFNWRLAENGHLPEFVPSIRVAHINETNLVNYLRKKVFHGKCFASVRVKEQRFPRHKRFCFGALSFVLPFLLTYRTVLNVLGRRRYISKFALSFPFVFLGLTAWSYGEMLGYLRRP